MDKEIFKEVHTVVKKRKLNYRFHDPNPTDVTTEYILKIFIDANKGKVEQAIQKVTKEFYSTDAKDYKDHYV